MVDYTAIIVSLVSLLGVIITTVKQTKHVSTKEMKQSIDDNQEKIEKISDAQLVVLQYILLGLCTEYLKKGWITPQEAKLVSNLYHAYHDELHGNDFITELYEKVYELPMKEG